MSDTKFTPGPWELWPLEDSDSVRIFAGTHYVGSIGNSDDEPSQTRANGHLIAAAPDMYEALKEIARADTIAHSTGKYSLVVESCAESARAAISKAEGKA